MAKSFEAKLAPGKEIEPEIKKRELGLEKLEFDVSRLRDIHKEQFRFKEIKKKDNEVRVGLLERAMLWLNRHDRDPNLIEPLAQEIYSELKAQGEDIPLEQIVQTLISSTDRFDAPGEQENLSARLRFQDHLAGMQLAREILNEKEAKLEEKQLKEEDLEKKKGITEDLKVVSRIFGSLNLLEPEAKHNILENRPTLGEREAKNVVEGKDLAGMYQTLKEVSDELAKAQKGSELFRQLADQRLVMFRELSKTFEGDKSPYRVLDQIEAKDGRSDA